MTILATASTFDIANVQREEVSAIVDFHFAEVAKFTEGMILPMGLTPNHIKFSPEYKAAKAKLDRTLSVLKSWNRYIVKHFPKENANYYKAKRAERVANYSK